MFGFEFRLGFRLDLISNVWIRYLTFGFGMNLVRKDVNNSAPFNYGGGTQENILRFGTKALLLNLNLLFDNNNINSVWFDNSYEIVNYLSGFGSKTNPWSKFKSKSYSRYVASLHSKKNVSLKTLKGFPNRGFKILGNPENHSCSGSRGDHLGN
jgi:hypothetical protein